MSYNPTQSKPYIFLNNSTEQAIHDANVETVPTRQDDIPIAYNRDIVLDNVNGAGSYNSVDKTFSFQSDAMIFSDNQLISNYTLQFSAFSFRDKENNEVGVRGNELFINARHAYSTSDSLINSGSRSGQRANEICRLKGVANKEYKLTTTYIHHDIPSSRYSNFQTYVIQNNGLVFGFLL